MILIGNLETVMVKVWWRRGDMSIMQRSGKYHSHYIKVSRDTWKRTAE
jgi:hypothetical protein